MITTYCAECGDLCLSDIAHLYEGRILCDLCLKEEKSCINCGEPHEGGHFVPPSLGEEGFFVCKSKVAGS